MKDRISITLEPSIVKEIDRSVDGIFIRSRSDAIEKILKRHVVEKKTAVILAGGAPENLFIKELGVYRPLIDMDGIKLIEYMITKCREIGFVNIVIVGFGPIISKIYEVTGGGEKYKVRITFIEEKKDLGSAKTLELAKKYLDHDFLFLPCDSFFNFDLAKLWNFHGLYNGTITMGIHTRTSYNWKKGIVEMDGYHITSYEENPKIPKTKLSGVFIGFMKPDVFNMIPPGDVHWSLQENVFPKLADEEKLIGYPISGDWVNVHSKKDVENLIKLNKR
jgi:NDP-sugar pyrophosphorylase family protein